MKALLTLALRYLQGRKLRSLLTTLAITFGVMVIFGMNSLLPALMNAFQANVMAAAGQVDATITSKTGEAFPESIAGKVAAVPGVRAVSPSLERAVNLQPDYFDHDPATPDRIAAVTLVGADPQAVRSVASFSVIEGRFLEPGDRQAAVIAQSLAEEAGLKLGDNLSLPTASGLVDLEIVGLLPPRLLPGNEEVLVTLQEAQAVFDMPGQVNLIEAAFGSTQEKARQETEQAIIAALGPSFTIGALQAGAEILSVASTGLVIMNLFGVLALLMGGFIIFNTFRTLVAERRHDIGMLRSIGASRRQISLLILFEGLIQGVVGTALGMLLGYLLGWVTVAGITPMLQKFMTLQIGGPQFSWVQAAIAILAGVGITLAAGWLPARAASRVTPLEALRPSLGALTLRRMVGVSFWVGVALLVAAVAALVTTNAGLLLLGSMLFIAGLVLVAPALVNPIASLFGRLLALTFARNGTSDLAEGNLTRQPSRAAITASTTMIALAILIMAASALSSLSLTFTRMLKASLSSDYLILPPSVTTWGMNVGASPELAQQLRAIDGVAVVSSERFAGTQINGVAIGLLGIEPEAYNQVSGLTFQKGDPQTAFREMESGRGVILNGLAGSSAGAELGDTVNLLTPAGEAAYTVVGIASDYLNAKTTTGYISQHNIETDFGRTEDVFYQINHTPEADPAAVEAALKAAIRDYPQFKLISGEAYYQQNVGLFDAAFAGMYAMVIFLAVPSLIAMVNTLAIGVLERRREIGMLRAVGATRKQVRTVILAEALILAAIGTALGLLAGLYLGYMSTQALSAIGFPIDYLFPATGLLVAIAAGLIFGALAALLPARQAAGLEVVSALRYE